MTLALALAALSFFVSLWLTGVVRTYALHHRVIDTPNQRSSHERPTPRGGGLAILAAAWIALSLALVFHRIAVAEALVLQAGSVLLAAVGWVDDRRGVRPSVRLAIHVGVAALAAYMLGGLATIQVGNLSVHLGWAGYAVATVGIVWSINLFNFMDGIDGFAGSQAVLIFGTCSVLLFVRGAPSLGCIAAILAGASAGFLPWNWPPAKIFMGDVGSGAIGFLVAALAIASENSRSVPLVAVAIIGGVFISDATVTLLRRLLRGDRPADAHRDHAYQRMVRVVGSHRPITSWAAAVTALLSVVGAIGTLNPAMLMPSLIAASLLLATLLVAVERRSPM